MTTASRDTSEQDVWRTVQALNRAWTRGRCDELKDYFHENMIAITPTDRLRLEGRHACIDGWTAFVSATTKIHYWKELDPKIQMYGDTAIVTYYFEMSCDMGGKTIQPTGRDMLVLVREDGKWWVVADQFSPYPQS